MFKYGNLSSVSIGNSKSLIPRNLTFRQNDLFKSTSIVNNINQISESEISITESNTFSSTDISSAIYLNYTNDSFYEIIIKIKGQTIDSLDYGYYAKYYSSIFNINNNSILDTQLQYIHKVNNDINLSFTIENSKIKISMDNINNIKSSNVLIKII